MEKSLNHISQHFSLSQKELETYHPLAFAYVGDAVYDLIIRTMVVSQGNRRPNRYHHDVINYVSAAAQTRMYHEIKDSLTEEERHVFRRGKNVKMISPAKNQSLHDYRMATGFEALMGYLYLTGRTDRIVELLNIGLSHDQADSPEGEKEKE